MTRFLSALVLFLACLPPCSAAEATEEPGGLRISNDGLLRSDIASGVILWSGTTTIDHPRFHLVVRGSTSLFGGPAIRRTSNPRVPLKAATFKPEAQWISLVALGPSTLKLQDANGKAAVVHARRVVYVPASDRLLIDGKPWRFKETRKPAGKVP
jgi:hypothetical protein